MAMFDEFCGIVEEVDGEVKERARDRDAVDQNAGLIEMPSSGSAAGQN